MAISYQPGSLANLNIVLTGKTFGASRSEVYSVIQAAGGHVQDEVDHRTDLVVAVNPSRQTKKQVDAKRLSIPIMSDADFRDALMGAFSARGWINRERRLLGNTPAPAQSDPQEAPDWAPETPTRPKPNLLVALAAVAVEDPFAASF